MRIAVFSDVHGNLAALEAVLADIGRRGADLTVGLGDFVSGPFDPLGVASLLMGSGMPMVRGNHDRWVVEGTDHDWPVDAWLRERLPEDQRAWLAGLPLTDVIGGDVLMCHGTPLDDSEPWMDAFDHRHGIVTASRERVEAVAAGHDYPVLLCGHTHLPRSVRLADGRLLLNPGAVGLPFLLGSPDAHYAIVERRGGQWSAEFHAIPYSRDVAIGQALALNYPGFARALETGWATLGEL